ncbi:MAG: LemA family protein [Candidatus Paceibacterota bacterium]
MPITYILLAIVAVVVVWIIFIYNRLVTLVNRCEEAWSDIDVQLKRRHNLIPNLVETAKAYASHEKEVFQNVTEARSKAIDADDVEGQKQAENQLTGALKSLFAVSEDYPKLQASENFLELQKELRDTEDKIQAARRFYNNNVKDLNIKIEKFPSNIIASLFGFEQKDLFEVESLSEKDTPELQF